MPLSILLLAAVGFQGLDFPRLLEAYRSGEHAFATRELRSAPEPSVRASIDAFLVSLEALEDEEERKRLVLAAAMLETDALLASASAAARTFHLRMAERLLLALEKSERRDFFLRWTLALTYFFQDRGEITNAAALLQAAAIIFPDDTEIALAHGILSEMAGHRQNAPELLQQAEDEYRFVLERIPDHTEARLRLGRTLAARGRHEEARRYLETALGRTDDRALKTVALTTLGEVLLREGERERGMTALRAAVAEDPACQAATLSLALALRERGELEDARAILDELFARGRPAREDSWLRYGRGHAHEYSTRLVELRAEVSR